MTTVTAPDTTVWWDPATSTAAALDQLRLTDADVDADRVAGYAEPAGQLLNIWMDRCGPPAVPVPAHWHDAHVQTMIEMYRRKDAPASSVDGMMLSAWRPSSLNPLTAATAMMAGAKHRWGSA